MKNGFDLKGRAMTVQKSCLSFLFFLVVIHGISVLQAEELSFRAGAAVVDITPKKLPVLVNGHFFSRSIDKVLDPLHARCVVMDDGQTRIAMIVIDSCLIPLEYVDSVKKMITEETGIPATNIMISATHCHSAPSLKKTLGTPVDEDYAAFLPGKIVHAVARAQKNLVPAKIGWAVGNDTNNVYCRRFLMKEGTAMTNPFSDKVNDRAMMNPGVANPNKITRTGPVDSSVTVISILDREDKPLAVFANYSTHYAGVPGDVLSGDYFAVFAKEIEKKIAEQVGQENMPEHFVAIMSNGTSGDANCLDFLNPDRKFDHHSVGEETAQAAMAVWPNIKYFQSVPIRVVEKRITLNNRVPTSEEVQKAKDHVATLPEGKPKDIPDVYALGTIMMENWPKTVDIPIQAFRIGELGIAAFPAEVYGITGLEVKAHSPFTPTMNISQANGSFGYVPPPEQHALGGYNTWRTQGNCLEVGAEPKIKNTAIDLLKSLHTQN